MPTLEQHQSSMTTKAMVIGPNGSSKTGLLGSLANAGYRLFIWDFDNGLDILMDPKVVKPENRKNIFFKTFVNQLTFTGIPKGPADAITRAGQAFDNWVENGESKGNPYTWGEKDVVVIDTLTTMGNAAMQLVLQMGGWAGKAPQIQHWGEAMRMQEDTLKALYSTAVKCNVIVNAHITYIGGEEGSGTMAKGYPSALGSKLPPKIGSYFNSVLYMDKTGMGNNTIRKLRTTSYLNIDLKNPAPSVIPPIMEPDLAEYFRLVRLHGAHPAQTVPAGQMITPPGAPSGLAQGTVPPKA